MKKLFKSKLFGVFCMILAVSATIAGVCLSHWFFSGTAALALAPLLSNLSREDIEALAVAKLSDNFGGSPYENMSGSPYENFAGDLDEDDVYDGSEDVHLSFIGSGNSFLTETDGAVEVSYSVTNLTPSIINVAFANGSLTDATILKNNFGADCYLKDGVMTSVGGKDVVGTGIGTVAGIDGFVKFSERNAYRITHMVIQAVNADGSVNTAAYNKTMIVQRFSPFRKFGEERINLFKYYSVQQQNKEKIEIPLIKYDIQRDDQTCIVMAVDPGVTLTVTETIGAIQNQAATLYKKSVMARENIAKKTAGLMPLRTLRAKRGAIASKAAAPKNPLQSIMDKLKK